MQNKKIVILGAGPAGLTSAYLLCKEGVPAVVLEKEDLVGGIAKTLDYKGYKFDLGGHRFFTESHAVNTIWHEVLGDDLTHCRRLSRIYYKKRYFYYPLRIANVLGILGFWSTFQVLTGYLRASLFPASSENNFEQWACNRFGKYLYEVFFKSYTEKVWGMPCDKISSRWAAQRIKGLTLTALLRHAIIRDASKKRGRTVKTLTDHFQYPRYGAGMMWNSMAGIVEQRGGEIQLNSEVEEIITVNNRIESVKVKVNGQCETIKGSHFISTIPLQELIRKMSPPVPDHVLKAAQALRYRDFIIVVLIINRSTLFPDNWIYIHDPDVQVSRIQNFKNWSSHMVADINKTALGLEYFCFKDDRLWSMPDEELIRLAREELEKIGLVSMGEVEEGTVVRAPKAYPVYDMEYERELDTLRQFLGNFYNLQVTGRNGMHRYNNMDHSMLTAIMAVGNLSGAGYDLWRVNSEKEYIEKSLTDKENNFEFPNKEKLLSTYDNVLAHLFAVIDKSALAVAVGTVSGLLVFMATLFVIITDNNELKPWLELLNQYFAGYSVTIKGAFIGTMYSFCCGFLFGWLFAWLRNLCYAIYLYRRKRETEMICFKEFRDRL